MVESGVMGKSEGSTGPYPNLQHVVPTAFGQPTRTAKLLTPIIVLVTIVALSAMSLVGLCVAIVVFVSGGTRTGSMNAAQGFAMVTAVFSITYVVLHLVAAKYNEAVGITRPPELKLHAACFIFARLALLGWFMAFIAACVAVAKPGVCRVDNNTCQMEIAVVVASLLGFVATGVILTALEACTFPFEMPNFVHLTKRFTSRVNPTGDDGLERSVSRASSLRENNKESVSSVSTVEEKPLPRLPSITSEMTPQRPVTPLLPMGAPLRSGSKTTTRGWGEEWTHLIKDMKSVPETSATKASLDSAISLTYDSSSGYVSSSERSSHTRMSSYASTYRKSVAEGGAYVTPARRAVVEKNMAVSGPRRAPVARRRPRPRVVTPSSSISNISRRSPLSSVRSVEYPEVLVRPELRYLPPRRSSQFELPHSRSSSVSGLIPFADIRQIRRASISTSDQFRVRGPSKTLPRAPRPVSPTASTRRPIKRRTVDIKVPGAFPQLDRRPSFDFEQSLDDHIRKIEVEYVTRRQSRGTYSIASGSTQVSRSLSQKRRIEKVERSASLIRINTEEHQQALVKEAEDKRPFTRSEAKVLSQMPMLTPSEHIEAIPDVHRKLDSGRPWKAVFIHRSRTTDPRIRPGTAQPTNATLKEESFRRLSLGDLSTNLEDMFK